MVRVKDLLAMGAPIHAIPSFERACPAGVESWSALAQTPGLHPDLLTWIAARAPDLSLAERKRIAAESNDPAYWWDEIAIRHGSSG